MKNFLLAFAIALTGFANAQKGTYLVSGNLTYQSISNSQTEAADYDYFNFNPKVGYQFTDNWTLGIESSVNTQKTKQTSSYESKRNGYAIGGFVRYSKPLSETFSLFTDFGLGYVNTKERLTINAGADENTIKSNGFYAQLQPLLFLKVKNNFGINFGLGGVAYNNTTIKGSNNTTSSFSLNFGQAYTVGIQKNF